MSSDQNGTVVGTVASCWRCPVKSFQGLDVDHLDVGPNGPLNDRAWGIVNASGTHVVSAKRTKALLDGTCTDDTLTLPDGQTFTLASGDDQLDAALSAWLGQDVRLVRPAEVGAVSYEMTFEPPNDDAEYYEIPTPDGSFLDLAHLHILTSATLDGMAAARPDLDWSVRRFRPSLFLDVTGEPLVEQTWIGREVAIGDLVIHVDSPTVRCAMPLRAQPGGLDREPGLFKAMNELNPIAPNHLGVYASVVEPARVSVGDPVTVL